MFKVVWSFITEVCTNISMRKMKVMLVDGDEFLHRRKRYTFPRSVARGDAFYVSCNLGLNQWITSTLHLGLELTNQERR
jgi:hypothetical protein